MSESALWIEQFGLNNRTAPEFFSDASQLTSDVPQAHLLKRGFTDLELDGVLCAENTPLVYFRRVATIDQESVSALYRTFWHHGGAPVLVVVSDTEVNVYSGLTLPSLDDESSGLVVTLERVGDELAEFLLSVESGSFFHAHRKSFNPDHRVDRDLLSNLRDTRQQLNDLSQRDTPSEVLDGLLCRLVFTAYLFDRNVIGTKYLRSIGITEGDHLRDVLAISPTGRAKAALYTLFMKLAEDFNGDLFADNLKTEADWIVNKHIDVLSAFFHGTSVKTGQQSFWPYDFGTIPIETISAIYEHFLKDTDKEKGAFYTPRFLAEIVLDVALDQTGPLKDLKFFDPACGSGIFLVGLFNRIAHQWQLDNPRAANSKVARALMQLMQSQLFGMDVNPTACRIAAFSLYLAFLDRLTPRDIQQLQKKGRALPRLVSDEEEQRNITCQDFFAEPSTAPNDVSLVIGNPPWGSIASEDTPAGQWAATNGIEIPDNQIASAFIRKATDHVHLDGRVCFVLPAGVLFNHSNKAIAFQRSWVTSNTVECVLNLADYQRFLFEVAGYPAIVVRYRSNKPKPSSQPSIDYWSPKSDWTVTKAEVIRIAAEDRVKLSLDALVTNLDCDDAPQIWKRHFWATPRDRKLLDRLSDLPRLQDHVRQTRENSEKPWLIAQGFQPLGPSDVEMKTLDLESRQYLDARNPSFDLFLTPDECKNLPDPSVEVRLRSGVNTDVFRPPHVLISQGFSKVAFAEFSVSFRSSVRAICGPEEDTELLAFLAAYLRSDLASYFVFHTSSTLAVMRDRVFNEEMLRLPFAFPDLGQTGAEKRRIVAEAYSIIRDGAAQSSKELCNRADLVESVDAKLAPLVEQYFGISDSERELVNDTISISKPSTRPTRARLSVPTVKESSQPQRVRFVEHICELLNRWSSRGSQGVRGQVIVSKNSGVALAVFEKVDRSLISQPMRPEEGSLAETVERLRRIATDKRVALELVRGIKVFDRNRLYVLKPLDQRNWTLTAAMNDADEIAGSLLTQSAEHA